MTMSTAREKIEIESSSLLDTDIGTDIWALGITEKSISAEVVGNPYNPGDLERYRGSDRVDVNRAGRITVNCTSANKRYVYVWRDRVRPSIGVGEYADVDFAPRKQFDFIHIRYQSSGICDGPRIFRLAFEQTKPGGWIEVVENGPTSSRICLAATDENNKLISSADNMVAGFGTLNIACWIKQQLIDAGFVEVEEKAWKVSNRPWQKTIAGIGKFIVAFLSMRWVWDDTGTICQEKPQIQHFEPSVFVIARRP